MSQKNKTIIGVIISIVLCVGLVYFLLERRKDSDFYRGEYEEVERGVYDVEGRPLR